MEKEKQMITKITDKLFIANAEDARNEELLLQHNITAAINVAWEVPINIYDCIFSRKKAMFDNSDKDLWNTPEIVAEATNCIVDLINSPHPGVLIYCNYGQPRSVTIATAALWKLGQFYSNLDIEEWTIPNLFNAIWFLVDSSGQTQQIDKSEQAVSIKVIEKWHGKLRKFEQQQIEFEQQNE